MRGGAKGSGQQPAREGVEAACPTEEGARVRNVGAAGDFDGALKLVAGHLVGDGETAPAVRANRRGASRRQRGERRRLRKRGGPAT